MSIYCISYVNILFRPFSEPGNLKIMVNRSYVPSVRTRSNDDCIGMLFYVQKPEGLLLFNWMMNYNFCLGGCVHLGMWCNIPLKYSEICFVRFSQFTNSSESQRFDLLKLLFKKIMLLSGVATWTKSIFNSQIPGFKLTSTRKPAGVEIFGVPGNPVTQAGKWKKFQVK